MRTKTLLIAAAALAATVTASKAQTVYSQNVVGYINVTCAANRFTLLANPLDLGPGSNSINNVLLNGPVSLSAPAGYQQSAILFWTGSGFQSFSYYNSSDATAILSAPSPAGWYDGNFNLATNTLNPSQAAFLENASANPITVTLTGQVDQGTKTNTTVNSGLYFYSEPVALAGTPLDSTNVNFPAISGVDTYQAWTGTGYGSLYQYYNATDASAILSTPSPGGWYDGNFTDQDGNAAVWPNVGQGFLVNHGGPAATWTNVFNVQ